MSDAAERPSQRISAAGEPVAFEMDDGSGCVVLRLADGAVLHLHPIVMDVSRSSIQDERGQPVYNIRAGLAVRVMQPPTKGGHDEQG